MVVNSFPFDYALVGQISHDKLDDIGRTFCMVLDSGVRLVAVNHFARRFGRPNIDGAHERRLRIDISVMVDLPI